MIHTILDIAVVAVAAILSITLHGAAHGYAALALGDDTARAAGRLSLNPLAHIDRFGTIILPGFLLISQLLTIGHVGFMFGWAKPVPVSAWKFRDPRRGMMVVAAAGPAMNFVLAWLGALALHAVPFLSGLPMFVAAEFLIAFIIYNMVLGIFNLIPIPPLDGGRIIVGLLPLPLARAWARLERAGLLIILLLLFLVPALARQAGYDFSPVQALLGAVLQPVLGLLLMLAGHPAMGRDLLGNV